METSPKVQTVQHECIGRLSNLCRSEELSNRRRKKRKRKKIRKKSKSSST